MNSVKVTQLITHLAAYQAKYEALKYENTKLHELILSLTGVDLRIQIQNSPVLTAHNNNVSPSKTESYYHQILEPSKPANKIQGRFLPLLLLFFFFIVKINLVVVAHQLYNYKYSFVC